jgi:hypothetical protein
VLPVIARRLAYGLIAVWVAACGLTRGEPSQTAVPAALESGFLTDYSDLAVGAEGQATFVYRARELDVSGYDKILLDHVTLWRDAERGFDEIPDAELDRLVLRLFTDLWDALDEDYEMVSEPGPTVMRVAVAITDVGHAGAAMDMYSADVASTERVERTTGALGEAVRGFLVNASLEIELTDSGSDRVLAAALDRRLADRVEDGRFDDWTEVEWGFDAWAGLLATRLREARQSSSRPPSGEESRARR